MAGGEGGMAEMAVLGEVVNYGSMLYWSLGSKVSVNMTPYELTPSPYLQLFSLVNCHSYDNVCVSVCVPTSISICLPHGGDSGFVISLCDKP